MRPFCIWLTGLSGSGKSTIADELIKILTDAGWDSLIIDGDVLRVRRTKKLGFSKEDRFKNVSEAADLAVESMDNGEIVICALISPYIDMRDTARDKIGDCFIEVYVSTPLDVCEDRDPKGLYKRVRSGEIKNFTGVDDPYEVPSNPDLVIDTVGFDAVYNARQIIDYLCDREYLSM